MAKQTESIFTNPLLRWIDDRFPLSSLIKDHATEYYASKNFNIWYLFGVLSMVVLIIMLITGFFLTMNYKPSADDAFNSVEYIKRSVENGWIIRYMLYSPMKHRMVHNHLMHLHTFFLCWLNHFKITAVNQF